MEYLHYFKVHASVFHMVIAQEYPMCQHKILSNPFLSVKYLWDCALFFFLFFPTRCIINTNFNIHCEPKFTVIFNCTHTHTHAFVTHSKPLPQPATIQKINNPNPTCPLLPTDSTSSRPICNHHKVMHIESSHSTLITLLLLTNLISFRLHLRRLFLSTDPSSGSWRNLPLDCSV
jgi:hypothetical protein